MKTFINRFHLMNWLWAIVFGIVALAINKMFGHDAGVVLALVPPTWAAYNTRKANNLEVVPWVLWDSGTYTSGTTTSLTFFNSVQTTLDLGNMTVASMLPNPYAFLVRVPRFFIKASMWTISQSATAATQTSGFNDAALLGNTGVFTFTIGNKQAFQAPLWMVSAGGGASGPVVDAGATAANLVSGYGQVGGTDPRQVLTLWQPLVIDSAINFNVTITWPAGAVTIVQTTPKLCVALDGELSRPIQ